MILQGLITNIEIPDIKLFVNKYEHPENLFLYGDLNSDCVSRYIEKHMDIHSKTKLFKVCGYETDGGFIQCFDSPQLEEINKDNIDTYNEPIQIEVEFAIEIEDTSKFIEKIAEKNDVAIDKITCNMVLDYINKNIEKNKLSAFFNIPDKKSFGFFNDLIVFFDDLIVNIKKTEFDKLMSKVNQERLVQIETNTLKINEEIVKCEQDIKEYESLIKTLRQKYNGYIEELPKYSNRTDFNTDIEREINVTICSSIQTKIEDINHDIKIKLNELSELKDYQKLLMDRLERYKQIVKNTENDKDEDYEIN